MAGEGDYVQGSAFGDERPAEPASSILATHFAPRLATQGHEPQRLSREAFSQLRQELLGEKYTQSRMDEGITDINKLICIILKAGLEVSPTSSAPEEDLEGQVLDCLEIIQVSIDKAPQALWDVSDPLILGEDVQAPLFSWLILRLIRVTCTWHVEAVQDRVHSIFTSMACLQYKQVRSSPSCYGISAFLRACALGTLMHLVLRVVDLTSN
jgi:serine/threonine-protein kinase ATR